MTCDFAPNPFLVARADVITIDGTVWSFERTGPTDTMDLGHVDITSNGESFVLTKVKTDWSCGPTYRSAVKPLLAAGRTSVLTVRAADAERALALDVASVSTTFATGLVGVWGRIDSAEGWWSGLDIGRGWWPLVGRRGDELAAIAPDHRVHQVKEKFGGLRFYAERVAKPAGPVIDAIGAHGVNTVRGDLGADRFSAAIRSAETEADRTCEECGATESVTLRQQGWWATLCDPCDAARRRSRKAR